MDKNELSIESRTVIKSSRFQIVEPLDIEWKELGTKLNDLSYHTTIMANRAIQLYWEYNNMRLSYKKEHGKYPDDKELYGQSFRNHVYHILRELCPSMAASNTSQTVQFVVKRWKNDLKEIMKLKKSIPSFKIGTPIQVAASNYKINILHSEKDGEKDKYVVEATLNSKDVENNRVKFIIYPGDYRKKAILENLINQTYKQSTLVILKKKSKWFVQISHSHIVETPTELDPGRVMNITFCPNNKNLIQWDFSFNKKVKLIPIGEALAAEKKIFALTERKKDIQRSAGQHGHGRKRKLLATKSISGKEANIRDTLNHKYSRRIIDVAKANHCGYINIKANNKIHTLANWPWANLVAKINYKAHESGIYIASSFDKGP